MPAAGVVADPFEHIALLYHDEHDYAQSCADFVRRGLEADDPVLVSVPAANGELIREALGGDAAKVGFADMKIGGRNPGRILPWMLLDFAQAHHGRRVWIVGEPIWPGRTAMEYPACAAHEASVNTAFAGRDAAMLCAYDAGRLDRVAIDDAHRTHPMMADVSKTWASPAYDDPIGIAARFNQPLPDPPAGTERIYFAEATDLAMLRDAVTKHATAAAIAPGRIYELVMAINELATNSIEHTPAGKGTLAVWAEPGMLVCQIDDHGKFTDPMAGRIPPAKPGRGHGLTLVNQFADLLRTHYRPDGTSFRLHMHTPAYQPQ